MNINHTQKGHSVNPSKEKGATLISALSILMVLTIVGISSTRMSILDINISRNDEQQMMMYQEAENALKKITKPVKLYDWIEARRANNSAKGITDINTSHTKAKANITNLNTEYACVGNGGAVSIGPEVPSCELYDFHIDINKKGTGTRDIHHRGAGKEVPHNGGSY
ncbi:MAG: pilus assembly PilX N-terminal domain-containing protein [Cocleimonas sp.]|nr:pilus assembly PilX N-terminal domain-containing protein [Cocleimonas sp.]